MKRWLALALPLLCAAQSEPTPTPAAAQGDADERGLLELYRLNSYPIALAGGRMTGRGAEFLLSAADKAQFLVIGEQHNGREIPIFTAALFAALRTRSGYRYLALEQDPFAVRSAALPPLAGSVDRIAFYARKYPNAFTFNTDQELEMIGSAGTTRDRRPAIWGLDQVFGATHVLERLAAIAPNAAIRRRTARIADEARQAETERLPRGARFMLPEVPKSAEFTALPEFYTRRAGSEADRLISQLSTSLRIYGNWWAAARQGQPTRYAQGYEREQNMKLLFMQGYGDAQRAGEARPRVVLKLGHQHAIRGENWSGLSSLGNFVSELATSEGTNSFHLAIYANNDRPGYYDVLARDPDYGPLMRSASSRAWTVVDLRPLRPLAYARRLPRLTAEMRRVVFGFDAVLLVGSATEGTYVLTKSPSSNSTPSTVR